MLRVTTLHASSASNTAQYYTQYLTGAPGEVPGVWSGRQAVAFGLSGAVETEELERLLSGHDPLTGVQLGYPLVDRTLADGRVNKAVGGFDATFSAPKSVSVLWALTGDDRFLQAHDIAVTAALEHLERFGSTTRVRCNGGRLHPDTNGQTIAAFRQTTSRDDDPQIHTHAVISAKVQTADGRWLALDARYLKLNQRMLGGLYQSVLRNELTNRLGVEWKPIVNGQAEIAGFSAELVTVFSKRSAEIDAATKTKVDEFRQRQGCAPSPRERAAMEREASADTRASKSGLGADQLVSRWRAEAAELGWTVERLVETVERAAEERLPMDSLSVADIVEEVSAQHSSWGRPDVVQAICDRQRPTAQMSGTRWAAAIERAADRVLGHCVDLDPPDVTTRRTSDGRSLWIEPHDHVRLGYAATEHGYQSDTVNHAIALVSAATTRRGLYVAATRGRDDNLLCVVTATPDVAEARDVLEMILAFDRADIPAVTQRRALAGQVHGHEPAPAPRLTIPECFEAMLDQACADLATAQAGHAAHAAERERLRQAVVAAEQRLRDVDAATAAARDAGEAAIRRVQRARGDLAEAHQRLATAPRVQRRQARREVTIAQRRAADAEDYLERTRQRTSPSIARYDQAIAERDRLREDLRHRSADEVISAARVRGDNRRVDALQTWRYWADGQAVSVERLSETTATLGAERGPNQAHSRALEQTIKHWADRHDIVLRPRQRIERDRSRVAPDISL
jgi:conjugative relaxase-like TrwC/TraI family protein